MSEDSLSAYETSEATANLDISALEDLDFDVIGDMPWAQELWNKVKEHNKKGFLNWCAIVKKIAGTKKDDINDWNTQYLQSVDEVLIDMVTEMSVNHSSIVDKMEDLLIQLQKACIELHQPMPEIKHEGLSLLEAKIQLMNCVKEYEVAINAKKQDMDILNKKQTKLCKELDLEPQINLKYPPLPTQAQLDNMKEYLLKLELEKFEREEKYINVQSEIVEIVEEIKYKPNNDFERKVLSFDDNMILTADYLKKMEYFAKCLKEIRNRNITEKEISQLRTKIENLWTMLDIDLIDRNEFRALHTGSSLDVLEALKIEAMRCKKIRNANIKKYVQQLRLELQSVWQKCHCSNIEKSSFNLFYSDCYTEELLELHEAEIQKWKNYYEENKKLFEMLNKHKELWNKMVQLEENVSDINRLKNRGGQLLQEEKERNKLTKRIPRLEEQILTLSQEFFNKKNILFMTFGKTVEEYIQQSHADRENDRKMKLTARNMQRNKTNAAPSKTPASLLSQPSIARLSPKKVQKITITHATFSHKKRWSLSSKDKQKRRKSDRKNKKTKKDEPTETGETTYTVFQAMKMPPSTNESADNGIYEYEENSLAISNEEIENNAVEDFDAPPENDFSEYMWMENEEEFDKEVMQRLEEEALMEECIAYMNTEATTFYPSPQGSPESSQVVTSELNPEAAEFIPSSRMEPSLEEPSTSTESP